MKQVVYISNSESKNIEVWNLNNSGHMNLIQIIKTNGQIQPIEIISHKNLLYAGIRPDNQIVVYSINNDGFLEEKTKSYIPGHPNYISFNSTAEFLFCSSYHSNCLSVSPLNKNGIPQNPTQTIYDIQGCHASKINKKYHILFITSLKGDCIYLYYLTNSGMLKGTKQKLVKTLKKSGPRHIVFCPSQDFAYTINELNGTIDVWKIYKENHDVKVQNIQNINIFNNTSLSSYWSSDIHITSCGRFLYTSDRFFNTISLFYVHQNNNNKIVFITSYKTEEQPRSFCINSNDSFLIVAGQKSNTLTIYKISRDNGTLTKIKTYLTSKGPVWVLTHQLN